jgi:hypothetical protein
MKLLNSIWLCVIALSFCPGGCAHSPKKNYDPSISPDASADLIKVVSLTAHPLKPIAPEPWHVTMKVKNTSAQPLENVVYRFLLGGKGEQLGEGKIARLDPGATVSVTSDVAKVQQGTYRVEGRVFLQKTGEPQYSDRMNNWMATTVVVAQ